MKPGRKRSQKAHTIRKDELLYRRVRRRRDHITVIRREVLNVVINLHIAVTSASAAHLHAQTRVCLRNFIIWIHKREHAVVATHHVTGLERLAFKRFVIVQTLRARFCVVFQQIVVGITDKIVF